MQEILVVVFRMVEVSDDQLPILGPEQFDFREHGLNGWLYWTATASAKAAACWCMARR